MCNIFLYWIGTEYKLIKILRNIIYLHSTNGNGYNVHFINHENINSYVDKLPDFFYNLLPANQADYVRIYVINKYGGIWLDSDTLVVDKLDELFNFLVIQDGFFVKHHTGTLCNGVFGSKPNTKLTNMLVKKAFDIINHRKNTLGWNDIGGDLFQHLYKTHSHLFNEYKMLDGPENIFPIKWKKCKQAFVTNDYCEYKHIERVFQPVIILVNSVYKELENKSICEILNGNMPLNYFINKSITNMTHLKKFDFMSICTDDFDKSMCDKLLS